MERKEEEQEQEEEQEGEEEQLEEEGGPGTPSEQRFVVPFQPFQKIYVEKPPLYFFFSTCKNNQTYIVNKK